MPVLTNIVTWNTWLWKPLVLLQMPENPCVPAYNCCHFQILRLHIVWVVYYDCRHTQLFEWEPGHRLWWMFVYELSLCINFVMAGWFPEKPRWCLWSVLSGPEGCLLRCVRTYPYSACHMTGALCYRHWQRPAVPTKQGRQPHTGTQPWPTSGVTPWSRLNRHRKSSGAPQSFSDQSVTCAVSAKKSVVFVSKPSLFCSMQTKLLQLFVNGTCRFVCIMCIFKKYPAKSEFCRLCMPVI